MAFWSGESLKARLRALDIISDSDFSDQRVDCAAYTLRVGDEVYVSPSERETDPQKRTATKLGIGQSFSIPPGQFAFIITEEAVHVPKNVIGFISMKSGVKLGGLINVSGFHVDPGYSGKLVFSVFNAGPRPVHLKRREECFLIWFADLDIPDSAMVKTTTGYTNIPSPLINKISGEMLSFEGLNDKIAAFSKDYESRIHSVEKQQTATWTIGAVLVTLLVSGIAVPFVQQHWPWSAPNSTSPASTETDQNRR